MFRLVNWLANSVIFPLIPMVAVWFFKGLETDSFTYSNLSATDIAFASAMICVVSIVRSKNITNDNQLQETISNIFSVSLVICLILFTSALLYQVQSDVLMSKYYSTITKSLNSNCVGLSSFIKEINPNIHDHKLQIFRVINSLFSAIIVLLSVFCNYKYDLDRP